jgi:hypothetical protein
VFFDASEVPHGLSPERWGDRPENDYASMHRAGGSPTTPEHVGKFPSICSKLSKRGTVSGHIESCERKMARSRRRVHLAAAELAVQIMAPAIRAHRGLSPSSMRALMGTPNKKGERNPAPLSNG